MAQQILISGNGGTGSSMLTHAFVNHGMWPGDRHTFYDYSALFEHRILTSYGTSLNEGPPTGYPHQWKIPGESIPHKIANTARAYVGAGVEATGGAPYGFKVVTYYDEERFQVLMDNLAAGGWHDIYKVLPIRHPWQWIRRGYSTVSETGRGGHPMFEYFTSWATKEAPFILRRMREGWIPAIFPDIWDHDGNDVLAIIRGSGLRPRRKMLPRFNPERIRGTISDEERQVFEQQYKFAAVPWQHIRVEAHEILHNLKQKHPPFPDEEK